MKKTRVLLLFLACYLGFIAPAAAHRVGVPTTSIEWNERTNKWEVTHRLSVHDFEEETRTDLSSLADDPAEISTVMFEYVHTRFQMVGLLSAQYVGAEIDENLIYVYFELWAPDQLVLVSNVLLMDARATGAALLNVKSGDDITSTRFEPGSGWQPIRLDRPE